MTAMGIIGCSIFSEELAYLIRRDPDIKRVVMIDNPQGRVVVEKLERSKACKSIWLVESDDISAPICHGNQLICWMNPTDLHDSQEKMRTVLSSEIATLAPSVDCIMLMYGQCRCQTLDVEQLQAEVGVPLVFLRDDRNVVVDDCICALLGSSERYLNAMNMHKGAVFVTPSYIEDYAAVTDTGDIVQLVEGIEQLRMALEYSGYPMILKLETTLGSGKDYDRKVRVFASIFDMDVLTLSCDLEVFENTYDWAKSVDRDRARKRDCAEVDTTVLS